MSSVAGSSGGSTGSYGASTISGGIAFAGLGSGTDFGSMIDQLRKIEEIPKNRLELWKADWQKRVDGFDQLIKGMTTLSKKFSSMDTLSTFLTKAVGSTKSTAINATAAADTPLGSYKINVTQLATNAMLTTKDKIASSKDEVIAADQDYVFSYTYGKDKDGNPQTRDLTIPKGTTVQSFVNIVNNDTRNPGVKASLIKSGDGYVFQLQGKDTGDTHDLRINDTTTLPKFVANTSSATEPGQLGTKSSVASSPDADIAPDKDYGFAYSFVNKTDGNLYRLDTKIPQGSSLQDLADNINRDTKTTGVSAKVVKFEGGYTLNLTGAQGIVEPPIDPDPANAGAVMPTLPNLAASNFSTSDTNLWYDRPAQDAQFYLDGRSNQILSSASNSLTEVIPGLTINLTDTTDTLDANGNILTSNPVILTVTNDAGSAKEKVKEFVSGINELLKNFQDLTKVDKSKTTKDRVGSASQFNSQKGEALTGNYGVQLLNTKLKSMSVSTASGFLPLEKDGTGDVFWTLSTIGITMDSDESSPTFGQMVIKEGESEPGSPFRTLDEALKDDPEAVAELFAADKIMRSNSPDFSCVGMLDKTTLKGGNHDVSYTVAGGVVTNMKIDGVNAIFDSESNEWTSLAPGSKGLVLRVDNLTEGSHSGSISVKQGKINEINEMLKAELKGAGSDVAVTGEKGSLLVLRENYINIMENVDKKLAQEEKRLLTWETRQRAKFARLDTLLSGYSQQMTANASALGSANSNSK